MNKILIVGHPQSGYEDVERLLHTSGMACARPSRREGLLPTEIGNILCKAHEAPMLSHLGKGRLVHQIGAAPLWHGLAMDLVLGNIDQALWGWADPQAIYLLDYWRDLDPTMHFVLVYDEPQSALTRLPLDEAARMTRSGLQRRIDAWVAYNRALLSFHRQHPQRSLLIHSEEVRRSVETYLDQIRLHIDAPWPDRQEGGNPIPMVWHPVSGHSPTAEANAVLCANSVGMDATLSRSTLAHFVASALIRPQRDCHTLYTDLQQEANLPFVQDCDALVDPALSLEAWMSIVDHLERLQHHRSQNARLHAERDDALREVHQRRHEQSEAMRRHEEVQREMARALDAAKSKAQAAEQKVGEAVESRRQANHEAHELQQRLKRVQQEVDALKSRPASNTAAGNDPKMLQQLLLVQEELVRFHEENERLKLSARKPLDERVWFGAGDRVREDLAYRIGSRMLRHGRSVTGWLTMPWGLLMEVINYRLTRHRREINNLPPIEAYRDAQDAERVRQHLSYRLGHTCLTHMRDVRHWIRLPFALMRELRVFRDRSAA